VRTATPRPHGAPREVAGLCDILAYVRIGITLALAVAALLAACAAPKGDPTPSQPPVPTEDPAISRLVPEGVRRDGQLTVATDPTYPPLSFVSPDGQVQGAEIDLVAAIATVLGLQPQFEEEAFTAIPAAVRTGRYELGVAGLAIRPDQRLLNNAVIYLRAGSQLVRSASAPNLTRQTLCGEEVAAVEGSVQIEELVKTSRTCRSVGQPSVAIQPAASPETATESVLAGRVAGFLADSPVSQDIISRYPGELAEASRIYDVLPLGMLTAAEYTRFTRAVRLALQQLIDSGYYAATLDKWNVDQGAVKSAQVRWADYTKRGKRKGK